MNDDDKPDRKTVVVDVESDLGRRIAQVLPDLVNGQREVTVVAADRRNPSGEVEAPQRESLIDEYATAVASSGPFSMDLPIVGGDGFAATKPPLRRDAPKVGRNERCPCGSGAKHKRCCGA